jgi:hypothetical protein
MIYMNLDLKYQGKSPLDYQYTLNFKNDRQEGKINLLWGWLPVGKGWAQEKRE